eukprot:2114302-Prymnesium_polylepis.1
MAARVAAGGKCSRFAADSDDERMISSSPRAAGGCCGGSRPGGRCVPGWPFCIGRAAEGGRHLPRRLQQGALGSSLVSCATSGSPLGSSPPRPCEANSLHFTPSAPSSCFGRGVRRARALPVRRGFEV